jgi:hypothetical protein
MYPSSCGITSCLVSSFFLGDVTSGIATTFWLEKVYDQCLKWFTYNSHTPPAKRQFNTVVTLKTLHSFKKIVSLSVIRGKYVRNIRRKRDKKNNAYENMKVEVIKVLNYQELADLYKNSPLFRNLDTTWR